jgi:hypothetical protein
MHMACSPVIAAATVPRRTSGGTLPSRKGNLLSNTSEAVGFGPDSHSATAR